MILNAPRRTVCRVRRVSRSVKRLPSEFWCRCWCRFLPLQTRFARFRVLLSFCSCPAHRVRLIPRHDRHLGLRTPLAPPLAVSRPSGSPRWRSCLGSSIEPRRKDMSNDEEVAFGAPSNRCGCRMKRRPERLDVARRPLSVVSVVIPHHKHKKTTCYLGVRETKPTHGFQTTKYSS